jgi:uncharacterized protein YndB with AHSA1/START domain
MATDSIRLSTVIAADSERLYRAWLDAGEHGAFTGGTASIEPWVGGRHSAFDGYIQGTTLALDEPRLIIQTWRSTEFPEESDDSKLEIRFESVPGGTQLTLIHTEIPEGQGEKYRKGWEDFYFKPMKEYFEGPAAPAAPRAPKAAAAAPAARPTNAKAAPAKRKAAGKPAARKVAKKRKAAKPAARKVAKRKAAKRLRAKAGRKRVARKAVKKARRVKSARRPGKRAARKSVRRAARPRKRATARRRPAKRR